jgi:hypothetical protein
MTEKRFSTIEKRFLMTQTAAPTIWTVAKAALKRSFLHLDNGTDLIFLALNGSRDASRSRMKNKRAVGDASGLSGAAGSLPIRIIESPTISMSFQESFYSRIPK